MQSLKKLLKHGVVVATVASSFYFVHSSVSAETEEEIQAQRSNIQSDINEKQSEISQIEQELVELNEQIMRSEEAIEDNQKIIEETEVEITEAEEEADQLDESIQKIQDKIDKRNEILKDRISSLQQNGGSQSYLEVLFGATDFLDFIDRISLVTKITQADQDLLKSQEEDKLELETKKNTLETKLEELEAMKLEYEGMQEHIKEQVEQNEQLKEELEEKKEANSDILDELRIEDQALANKADALKQADQEEQSSSSEQSTTSTDSTNSNANIEQYSRNSSNSSSKSSNQPQSAPASGNLQTAINAGYKYVGNSVYVFGGGRTAYDIANGRFDCSGFVSWAFKQAGVNLPASTAGLSSVGTKVSTSEMKPGDLVFFNTYKTNGHVGIYIGNNQFIGSQNSTGVAVANMGSGYWKNHFAGHVRRVMQ
ncbi:C40 family peptidase [Gracilibacillus sp. YIM 98692]|uniref:C40 family peptidase n=1 Tax=Gracilibacillus sp. YIM 98692 TaxID=2663532 RepID=UPI0013D40471|nr:C40 family peptidase [Gracilibacillus sp. YIM 98692]